jgi:hypothetical protein
MRITTALASFLFLALAACSGIEIEPKSTEAFAAANYRYYRWRTEPLPARAGATTPIYLIDPVLRREVDAGLRGKGYVLDPQRAEFTVDYIYAAGLVQGEESAWASNISARPSATANRHIDQASVDNAIALGGVKQTNNIVLQFNDSASNKEVWQVTLTKIVENANNTDTTSIHRELDKYIERALDSLPPARSP